MSFPAYTIPARHFFPEWYLLYISREGLRSSEDYTMKNCVLQCPDILCLHWREVGASTKGDFVGHFVLTKRSLIFLALENFSQRMDSDELTKHFMREAIGNPGSLWIPLGEVQAVEQGETEDSGSFFTVFTAPSQGSAIYTFRCAAYCGEESDHFESDAYPYILRKVRSSQNKGGNGKRRYGPVSGNGGSSRERGLYLQMLELSEDASPDEVKAAYRELCLIWHPDRHPERLRERTTRKLQEINHAYAWLTRQASASNGFRPGATPR